MAIRTASVLITAALVVACASTAGDVARFQAQSNQEVSVRDGGSFLTSRAQNSIVTIRPGSPVLGKNPEYIVGIQNISEQPLDFNFNKLVVTQIVDGNPRNLKVYSAHDLVADLAPGQIGTDLMAGFLAGIADANSNGDTSLGDAIIAKAHAASEEDARAVQELTLHDEVIQPGETYAGKLQIEAPAADSAGARVYAIDLDVGPDQHEILIVHQKATS